MIVVDASVAAKWLLVETHSEKALALVVDASGAKQAIVAPSLLPFEVANILRQRMIRKTLTLADADRLMVQFLAFPVTLILPEGLSRRALAIADTLGLQAAYDAHYLALTERLGCDFWTDDQRLLRLVARRFPFVRWIGDYPAAGAAQ